VYPLRLRIAPIVFLGVGESSREEILTQINGQPGQPTG
jgi:hypothetical protein